jgi:hypothetical protein
MYSTTRRSRHHGRVPISPLATVVHAGPDVASAAMPSRWPLALVTGIVVVVMPFRLLLTRMDLSPRRAGQGATRPQWPQSRVLLVHARSPFRKWIGLYDGYGMEGGGSRLPYFGGGRLLPKGVGGAGGGGPDQVSLELPVLAEINDPAAVMQAFCIASGGGAALANPSSQGTLAIEKR